MEEKDLSQEILKFIITFWKQNKKMPTYPDFLAEFKVSKYEIKKQLDLLVNQEYLSLKYNTYSVLQKAWDQFEEKPKPSAIQENNSEKREVPPLKKQEFFIDWIHIFHLVVRYSVCVVAFFLEVFLVVRFFGDLPKDEFMKFYWHCVAFVLMGGELYLIIEIRSSFKNKDWPKFWSRLVAYSFTLIIFFLSALGYNLKAIEGKAQAENLNSSHYDFLTNTIARNNTAIQKYNFVIETTNNMGVLMYYRGLVNELTATNEVLYLRIQGSSLATNSAQSDSFTLISSRMHWSRSVLLFVFLSGIWAILAFFLFITAPDSLGEEKIIVKSEEKEKI